MTASPEETHALGLRLGGVLRPGDVVALTGELGSGKTTLVQGIAQGLGYDPDRITSPTFVLVRAHRGEVPLIHIDAYRLAGASEAAWLDVEGLFAPDAVTLIEWAERLAGLLPTPHLEVALEHVSANRRRIRCVPDGPGWSERLRGITPHETAGD